VTFSLTDEMIFEAQVSYREPDRDGRMQEHVGMVLYRVLPDTRIEQAVQAGGWEADIELMVEAVVGVPDLRPINDAQLRRWLAYGHRRRAVVTAYLAALGTWEGNSSAPSGAALSAGPGAEAAAGAAVQSAGSAGAGPAPT